MATSNMVIELRCKGMASAYYAGPELWERCCELYGQLMLAAGDDIALPTVWRRRSLK